MIRPDSCGAEQMQSLRAGDLVKSSQKKKKEKEKYGDKKHPRLWGLLALPHRVRL